MKIVKIGFYKKNGFVANIIKFLTRGQYSHVAIEVNNTFYEAKEFSLVRKYVTWTKNSSQIDIYELEITDDQERRLVNFLEKQIGKKYDYLMVLGFLFYVTREKRKSRGKWFCTELIFAALEKVGVKLLNNIEPWKVSPATLSYSTLLKYKETV